MTRVTNFRRKRTYVEAGFEQEASEPTQKKTKRVGSDVARSGYSRRTKSKADRVSSETRRLKRISEKMSITTCFACRETGHVAKDCPTETSVGICYRCGSTKHALSRCKKPADETNSLPFASCFVCKGKGHLASSCPENKQKGVYPNGGSCKLCGDTTHLAKDCELRKKDVIDTSAVIGINGNVGADEDDFHSFKRRKRIVDKEEDSTVKRRPTIGKSKVVYF